MDFGYQISDIFGQGLDMDTQNFFSDMDQELKNQYPLTSVNWTIVVNYQRLLGFKCQEPHKNELPVLHSN